MDETLLQRLLLGATTGTCPDCGDERVLLPVDESGLELCCADCDAAVWVVDAAAGAALTRRLAG